MKAGAYISGAGHLILILWVVLGGVIFRSADPDLLETTDVRLVSEEEFLELTATQPEPDSAQTVDAPEAPATEDAAASPSPGGTPPEMARRPEIAEPTEPDPTPEAPDLTIPEANVETTTPDAPVAQVSDQVQMIVPPALNPGRPREAPRVAALPIPEAPPSTQEAPEFVAPQAPAAETPAEETPVVEETPTAPQETTTEIVTEATAQEPEGAGVSGLPPRLRPPASAEVSQSDPEPAELATPTNEGPAAPTETSEDTPAPAVGPPLTFGEVDRLVVALQNCWSIGTLSTAAASSTVIVGVTMDPNGTPVGTSIRMIDGRGPDDGSIKVAYEYAKRAVLRCGRRGFPLPKDKFAHWAEIEITFSPEEGLLFE